MKFSVVNELFNVTDDRKVMVGPDFENFVSVEIAGNTETVQVGLSSSPVTP
jgi:hypothetical protein